MSIVQVRAYAVLVAQGGSSLGRQRDVFAEHQDRAAELIEA